MCSRRPDYGGDVNKHELLQGGLTLERHKQRHQTEPGEDRQIEARHAEHHEEAGQGGKTIGKEPFYATFLIQQKQPFRC